MGSVRPRLLDPGWLYLVAGLALIASTVLVGAVDNLQQVEWQRDRALALEAHRLERLRRYEVYLGALEREDPDLVLALAASELNELPASRAALEPPASGHSTIFAGLEPEPIELPARVINGSMLSRLATSESARPWLLAIGAICLFVALLPPARGRVS